MARTVDVEDHALKRDAYLDAAQTLIQRVGYDQMSIQDVLAAVGSSRGALYHYFPSKTALLDGVVERMVVAAFDATERVLADASLPAPEKLRRLFGGMIAWKSERRDLVLALVRVWLSDENTLVRDKLRVQLDSTLVPRLRAVIAQGVREGTFAVTSPEASTRVIVTLLLGAQDLACGLYLERQAGTVPLDAIAAALTAFSDAMARVLGAPPEQLSFIDDAVVRAWFA